LQLSFNYRVVGSSHITLQLPTPRVHPHHITPNSIESLPKPAYTIRIDSEPRERYWENNQNTRRHSQDLKQTGSCSNTILRSSHTFPFRHHNTAISILLLLCTSTSDQILDSFQLPTSPIPGILVSQFYPHIPTSRRLVNPGVSRDSFQVTSIEPRLQYQSNEAPFLDRFHIRYQHASRHCFQPTSFASTPSSDSPTSRNSISYISASYISTTSQRQSRL
jgi:hypothetical protein